MLSFVINNVFMKTLPLIFCKCLTMCRAIIVKIWDFQWNSKMATPSQNVGTSLWIIFTGTYYHNGAYWCIQPSKHREIYIFKYSKINIISKNMDFSWNFKMAVCGQKRRENFQTLVDHLTSLVESIGTYCFIPATTFAKVEHPSTDCGDGVSRHTFVI